MYICARGYFERLYIPFDTSNHLFRIGCKTIELEIIVMLSVYYVQKKKKKKKRKKERK